MKKRKTNLFLLAVLAATPPMFAAQTFFDVDSAVAKKKVHVAFRDKDADHAQHIAAEDDGNQDQQARDSQRISKQPGLQDIPVHGLQDQRKDQEDQGVDWIDQQQDTGNDEEQRC